MALQPYQSLTAATGPIKFNEFNRWMYWGTVKLGQGSYPQAQILAGYNAGTKILNLSGGTTGLTMPIVFNQDYWGGNPGQTSRVYMRSFPTIQLDVSAVSSYQVTLPAGPIMTNHDYVVKVTPLNATGGIPRTNGSTSNPSHYFFNGTVTFSSNSVGVTWPAAGNGSTVTFNNGSAQNGCAFTVVRFANPDAAGTFSYVNVTDGTFTYIAGETPTGSTGAFTIIVPEFAAILVPIVGMMAMFFIFRSRKRKR
jgi:hypothetical protein